MMEIKTLNVPPPLVAPLDWSFLLVAIHIFILFFLFIRGFAIGKRNEEREPSRVMHAAWHVELRDHPSPKWVPRVMFSGQIEPDKWPLEELVRLGGGTTSLQWVRRGTKALTDCGAASLCLQGLGQLLASAS